jgi:ribonuclease T1
MKEVSLESLPCEVKTTLDLIKTGGTLPDKKDGNIFKNLEKVLPLDALNYHREYTVPTQKITTRGNRRLVIGKGGEVYYIDGHYNNFQKVI